MSTTTADRILTLDEAIAFAEDAYAAGHLDTRPADTVEALTEALARWSITIDVPAEQQRLLTVPTSSYIRYEFPGEHGPVVLYGYKTGEETGTERLGNRGFWIESSQHGSVAVSRYAMVTVLS